MVITGRALEKWLRTPATPHFTRIFTVTGHINSNKFTSSCPTSGNNKFCVSSKRSVDAGFSQEHTLTRVSCKSISTLLEVQPPTKENGQRGVLSGTLSGPGGVSGHGNICSTSLRGGKANEWRVPCSLPHSGALQLQRGVSRRCLQGHRAHLHVRWPDGSVATGRRAEIKLGWRGATVSCTVPAGWTRATLKSCPFFSLAWVVSSRHDLWVWFAPPLPSPVGWLRLSSSPAVACVREGLLLGKPTLAAWLVRELALSVDAWIGAIRRPVSPINAKRKNKRKLSSGKAKWVGGRGTLSSSRLQVNSICSLIVVELGSTGVGYLQPFSVLAAASYRWVWRFNPKED